MATIKEKVKEFYKKANKNNWTKFLIYANELKAYGVDRCVSYDPKEDCPIDSYRGFYNGTILKHIRLCDEMTADEKNTLTLLGFSLKPQCFWCRRPDGSALGINYCHILYAGRELTADELWLTDIKQRAIDLGYDIRDCGWIADCHIGWGFWGATSTDAWNAFDGFMKETGVTFASASLIKNFAGGHLYVINSFYAYGLYNITEPAHDTSLSIAILIDIDDAEEYTEYVWSSYEKLKEITIQKSGVFRIEYDYKRGTDGSGIIYTQIRKNGSRVGTSYATWDEFYKLASQELAFEEGDKLQLYASVNNIGTRAYIKNFRVYPIDKKFNVGQTIYLTGQLKNIIDNVALQGASIALYKNDVATGKTDVTNATSGVYSIPYTITEADAGLLKFKTYFSGT